MPGLVTSSSSFWAIQLLLLLAAIAISIILRTVLRPIGRTHSLRTAGEFASLSAMSHRYAEQSITAMLVRRELVIEQGKFCTGPMGRSKQLSPKLVFPADWASLEKALDGDIRHETENLERSGLLMSRPSQFGWALVTLIPFVVPLWFGLANQSSSPGTSGFVIATIFGPFLVAKAVLVMLFTFHRRTQSGVRLWRKVQQDHRRLRRAAPRDQADIAVALFGTVVLAGGEFDLFHKMRAKSSSSDGVGGSDGGGCGGGGCGGCGS